MLWMIVTVRLTAPLVKLIFSFLLSYPLAGILKRVPDARPAYKNIYSIRWVAELLGQAAWSLEKEKLT